MGRKPAVKPRPILLQAVRQTPCMERPMDEGDRQSKPRTIAAQALGSIEPTTKAVVPPVHVATTFVRDPDNQYRAGFVYGRPDNATVRQVEAVVAALEGAAEALLFGSRRAAGA